MAGFQLLTHFNEDFGFTRRLEWMTFDWRARQALSHPLPHAPNLGFVFINDETVQRVLSEDFGYRAGLYWPRHVYGRIVQELDTQGAESIALDVLFPDLRPDHEKLQLSDGAIEASDDYFARQMHQAGNVTLAAERTAIPPPLFRTNAWAVGDVGAQRDADGILRRAKAYEDYLVWHPAVRQAATTFDGFEFDTNRVLFTESTTGQTTESPIASDGTFDLATLLEVATHRRFPSNTKRTAKAFTRHRAWDLGITAAARYLGINLDEARIEPGREIVLIGSNNRTRTIPIDQQGRFYIDWSLTFDDSRLTHESAHSILDSQYKREVGEGDAIENRWRDKVVLIGSVASGNDLKDYGATPLEKETFLTSRYWNIANALIIDRFIQPPALPTELLLILTLSLIAGIVTWNMRTTAAALSVLLLGLLYLVLGRYLYLEIRYWLPLVLPSSSLFLTHFAMLSYRAVFEQREQRRIRNVFSKIVSPNVVHELLQAEKLALGGARREVTVFFSDVRGFTEMTDESHARAEEFVRDNQFTEAEAETYFDEQAQEVLSTVNLYLGSIADTVKQREGTLDKYIGDCVMAFWGAPTPTLTHASDCVRAAIDAQRAIHALNQIRAAENQNRETENRRRLALNLPPLPELKLLSMGSGINTGVVTVGLMGSEQHTFNYTVFGREVNLAARLEGLSGKGRILIGETTYRALVREDPDVAATCKELAPAAVKGFRTPVKIYEVPWMLSNQISLTEAAALPPDDEMLAA
jgi:class 3 adenylate cyclase